MKRYAKLNIICLSKRREDEVAQGGVEIERASRLRKGELRPNTPVRDCCLPFRPTAANVADYGVIIPYSYISAPSLVNTPHPTRDDIAKSHQCLDCGRK